MGNFAGASGMLTGENQMVAQMMPIGDSELVDISSTDHTVTIGDNRGLTCTSGTTLRVDYTAIDGTTKTIVLPAGRLMIGCRCVTKVYKTGTDALNIYVIR